MGVLMFNTIFSSNYFIWECFVCFLGTFLAGSILLFGTVLPVHRKLFGGRGGGVAFKTFSIVRERSLYLEIEVNKGIR